MNINGFWEKVSDIDNVAIEEKYSDVNNGSYWLMPVSTIFRDANHSVFYHINTFLHPEYDSTILAPFKYVFKVFGTGEIFKQIAMTCLVLLVHPCSISCDGYFMHKATVS